MNQPLANTCLVNFTGKEQHRHIIGCRLPETDAAHSEYIEIEYHHENQVRRDEASCTHEGNEVYFIVLKGKLDLRVDEKDFRMLPG